MIGRDDDALRLVQEYEGRKTIAPVSETGRGFTWRVAMKQSRSS